MLQAVGVLAIASVSGPARRLYIGGIPASATKGPQGCGPVKGTCAHLHVVGLQDYAALLGPIILQRQN